MTIDNLSTKKKKTVDSFEKKNNFASLKLTSYNLLILPIVFLDCASPPFLGHPAKIYLFTFSLLQSPDLRTICKCQKQSSSDFVFSFFFL